MFALSMTAMKARIFPSIISSRCREAVQTAWKISGLCASRIIHRRGPAKEKGQGPLRLPAPSRPKKIQVFLGLFDVSASNRFTFYQTPRPRTGLRPILRASWGLRGRKLRLSARQFLERLKRPLRYSGLGMAPPTVETGQARSLRRDCREGKPRAIS